MKKIVSIGSYRFELITLIISIIIITILVSLGNWQLRRLEQKNNFITKIENNISGLPIELNDALKIELYSKVKLSGHFIDGKNIFLYGQRSAARERNGYYLLSTFMANNNEIFLISRAWVPQSAKNNVKNFTSPANEEIIAIAMPGEEKKFFIPENNLENNIWFTLDLSMAQSVLGTTVKNYYLMQIDSKNLPEGAKPLSSFYLNKVRNDHLEYAITWYILAVCLFFIYIWYNLSQHNKGKFYKR